MEKKIKAGDEVRIAGRPWNTLKAFGPSPEMLNHKYGTVNLTVVEQKKADVAPTAEPEQRRFREGDKVYIVSRPWRTHKKYGFVEGMCGKRHGIVYSDQRSKDVVSVVPCDSSFKPVERYLCWSYAAKDLVLVDAKDVRLLGGKAVITLEGDFDRYELGKIIRDLRKVEDRRSV